eukprot:g27225.t1
MPLEKILKEKTNLLLEKQGLISSRQHSFVSGRSGLMSLIEAIKGMTRCVDEGRAVDVIYMDFSKAFDNVPHGKLTKKVKAHGIQENFAIGSKHGLMVRDK